MKIHHIGYLVSSIASAIEAFKNLGFTILKDPLYDTERKIFISFISNGWYVVELIEPDQNCELFKFTQKKIGNAPYHICYISNNLETEIEDLQRKGYLLLTSPAPAKALAGKKIAFLMSADIGLIEIVSE